MTQSDVVALLKVLLSVTGKTKISKRQIFLTSEDVLPNGTHRYFFGVTIETHAAAKQYAGLAVEWMSTVAQGLMPAPVGALANIAVPLSTNASSLGQKMVDNVGSKLDNAWEASHKGLRPVSETVENNLQLNKAHLAAHRWVNNVGLYGIIDIDPGVAAKTWVLNDKDYTRRYDGDRKQIQFMDNRAWQYFFGTRGGKRGVTIGPEQSWHSY